MPRNMDSIFFNPNKFIQGCKKALKETPETKTVVKGKEYSKCVIIIPAKDIKKLGWKEGDELNGIALKCGYL